MLDWEDYAITTENLDQRICDVEKSCNNTQTYREFIRESEIGFGLGQVHLESLTNEALKEYLAELDYLWTK